MILVRIKFVEKGDWDKMPGQNEAEYGVAQAGSEGLEKLLFKK